MWLSLYRQVTTGKKGKPFQFTQKIPKRARRGQITNDVFIMMLFSQLDIANSLLYYFLNIRFNQKKENIDKLLYLKNIGQVTQVTSGKQ